MSAAVSVTRPSRVPAVTLYGDFSSRSLPIAEAVEFCASHDVQLMLGRMQDGYLGREVVTLDDLAAWLDPRSGR